ncbi:hypothetical protein F383_10181 [Gossypium arboreum]|uniref:Uncharacterized protein n=1 Tax=Gossypium arboreum TaxID=29729 RepID=A0A0B0N2L9_GOSAR|nr:hypothetical protein F383_10181 [Gossypium arboreum]
MQRHHHRTHPFLLYFPCFSKQSNFCPPALCSGYLFFSPN